MQAEEIVINETNKMVEKFRTMLLKQGLNLTDEQEWIFRKGVSFGISVSSILLSSIPVDCTIRTTGLN